MLAEIEGQHAREEVAREAGEAVHQAQATRRSSEPTILRPGHASCGCSEAVRPAGCDDLPLAAIDLRHLLGPVAEPGPEHAAPENAQAGDQHERDRPVPADPEQPGRAGTG